METPVLSLSHLSTGYKKHPVATALTANLMPATLTALVGPNGAGKSTLLRTLAGFQPALSGTMWWFEKRIGEYRLNELARRVAVVLTARTESEALTVEDVVALGRMPYTGLSGRLSSRDNDIVAQTMAAAGIAPWRKRRIQTLSDGERQRVMIAKALAQQTPVIMLDEPTAFLDFSGKVMLLRLLDRLARVHHKTILFSTHDLELSFQLAHNLWVLSPDGLTTGTPQALAEGGIIAQIFATPGVTFDAEQMRFVMRRNDMASK